MEPGLCQTGSCPGVCSQNKGPPAGSLFTSRKGRGCGAEGQALGVREETPMLPPSLEQVRTASMTVCARSKDSKICCLQLVSNSRRETGSYSSPCRVAQTLLSQHCSPSLSNLRPVLIANKQPGSYASFLRTCPEGDTEQRGQHYIPVAKPYSLLSQSDAKGHKNPFSCYF